MTEPRDTLALVADPPALAPLLAPLAEELGVQVCAPGQSDARLLLVRGPGRLELRQGGRGAPGPVYVDFVSGRAAHRRRFGGGRGQPLARAAGLKGGATPRVLDATAGLGRDAFVLATLGCEVELVERSVVVAALLADGLRRAAEDPEVGVIARRMRLVRGDAIEYLRHPTGGVAPDVVYLDPMYPERDKSALVKKEMRLFRQLVGDDHDTDELLRAARARARARVVVKRPARVGFAGAAEPAYSISSPNTRYDVYLTGAAAI
ncbi:MAG: class I SAM-dependent methyltransferase [Candidatus Sedimenticola endophacoides]